MNPAGCRPLTNTPLKRGLRGRDRDVDLIPDLKLLANRYAVMGANTEAELLKRYPGAAGIHVG